MLDTSDISFRDAKPETARKAHDRLADAAGAFERNRFADAKRMLKEVDKLVPDVPEVIELIGLCEYRQQRWQHAIKQLEKFEALTNSVEQHPVLADCFRALKRHDRVEELWNEVGAASPGPELVEEARIIFAGSKADQGRLADAIRILETAPKAPKKPKAHHLRRWYALADLYERAGNGPRAKRLFRDIETTMPGFGDAASRARSAR